MNSDARIWCRDRFHKRFFQAFHRRYLIYNTCWEDPRVDRSILGINKKSRIAMITSAGCNALDYLLDEPEEIRAVDLNHRQNALLELKIALFLRGSFEDLDRMFGQGSHPDYADVYHAVRPILSNPTRIFLDSCIRYFSPHGSRKSFYFHGLSGNIAWCFRHIYRRLNRKVPELLNLLLDAQSLHDQKVIFSQIEKELFTRRFESYLGHPVFLSAIGVPASQRRLITSERSDGVGGFARERIKHVMTELSIRDNYFWRVYIRGCYSDTCRPNYLKQDHFAQIRSRVSHLHIHHCSLSELLTSSDRKFTHFILLDHQDWMAEHARESLDREWRLILDRSEPNARVLLRSASNTVDFIPEFARDRMRFFPDLTQAVHLTDRVGTYASLHLAEVL